MFGKDDPRARVGTRARARRRKLAGAACSVLAASALAAGAAQAVTTVATPEVGRCVKAATPKTGGYANSTCTTRSSKGNYEWLAPSRPLFSTALASGSQMAFLVGGRDGFGCATEGGTGEWAAGQTGVSGVTIVMTGCEYAREPCTTLGGAAVGEVRLEGLEGTLGVIKNGAKPTADKIGLDLYAPEHGQISTIYCSGRNFGLRGSVIVPLASNKPRTTQTLAFKATQFKQVPESFAGGAVDVPEMSNETGDPYQPSTITGTLTLTNEEALEINPIA